MLPGVQQQLRQCPQQLNQVLLPLGLLNRHCYPVKRALDDHHLLHKLELAFFLSVEEVLCLFIGVKLHFFEGVLELDYRGLEFVGDDVLVNEIQVELVDMIR